MNNIRTNSNWEKQSQPIPAWSLLEKAMHNNKNKNLLKLAKLRTILHGYKPLTLQVLKYTQIQ